MINENKRDINTNFKDNKVLRKLRKDEKVCKFAGCNEIFRATNNRQKYCPTHSKQHLKNKEVPRRNNPIIQWTCGCTDSAILRQLYRQNNSEYRALFSVSRFKTKRSTHIYSVKCICCGNEEIIEDKFIKSQSNRSYYKKKGITGRKTFLKIEKEIYTGQYVKPLKSVYGHMDKPINELNETTKIKLDKNSTNIRSVAKIS